MRPRVCLLITIATLAAGGSVTGAVGDSTPFNDLGTIALQTDPGVIQIFFSNHADHSCANASNLITDPNEENLNLQVVFGSGNTPLTLGTYDVATASNDGMGARFTDLTSYVHTRQPNGRNHRDPHADEAQRNACCGQLYGHFRSAGELYRKL
jgi:hypothetical protein